MSWWFRCADDGADKQLAARGPAGHWPAGYISLIKKGNEDHGDLQQLGSVTWQSLEGSSRSADQSLARQAGAAPGKIVGSAYGGSNPTPATTRETARDLGFPWPAGRLAGVARWVMMCHRGALRRGGYRHIAGRIRADQAVWRTACVGQVTISGQDPAALHETWLLPAPNPVQ